ncbi:MAG: TIM barrel protein [Armatimonadia bacterium]|nr:TIM barrel protein [Armatimonadia bacterium]
MNEPSIVGGLKIGIQSFTFRTFSMERCVASVAELGVSFIEFCGVHIKVDAPQAERNTVQSVLARYDVVCNAYGVEALTDDESANRVKFDFAKEWGVDVLTADPTPESFDCLDKLVDEYDIRVAIHNHGPGHRWAKYEDIAEAIKDHDPRIGYCVDTGHFLRVEGQHPCEILEAAGDRLHGVHLKSMDIESREYPLGAGALDLKKTLETLQQVSFTGPISIEYEEDPEDPRPELGKSLDLIRNLLA